MLAVQVARLREQAEEVAGRLLQAEALLAAVGGDIGAVEGIVARHVRVQEALDPDLPSGDDGGRVPSPLAVLLAAPGLVDGPGMALAVDLWLGPGSSEAVRKAAEAAATREETIGENDEKKR